ncbi:hypothetical protein EDB19DRAFT_2029745 [Suillus lakei]|nr:hypothetical protein EDB19DRAFT_2029745 [Suillus lakei]
MVTKQRMAHLSVLHSRTPEIAGSADDSRVKQHFYFPNRPRFRHKGDGTKILHLNTRQRSCQRTRELEKGLVYTAQADMNLSERIHGDDWSVGTYSRGMRVNLQPLVQQCLELERAALALTGLPPTNNAKENAPATDAEKWDEGATVLPGAHVRAFLEGRDEDAVEGKDAGLERMFGVRTVSTPWAFTHNRLTHSLNILPAARHPRLPHYHDKIILLPQACTSLISSSGSPSVAAAVLPENRFIIHAGHPDIIAKLTQEPQYGRSFKAFFVFCRHVALLAALLGAFYCLSTHVDTAEEFSFFATRLTFHPKQSGLPRKATTHGCHTWLSCSVRRIVEGPFESLEVFPPKDMMTPTYESLHQLVASATHKEF